MGVMGKAFPSTPIRATPIAILLGEPVENVAAPAPTRVQIMRSGTFHHDEYGTFSLTKEIFLSMVKNFKANVRGVDLAIDYGHKSDEVAAAWIRDIELVEAGGESQLWAEVEWTPEGQETVQSKKYRYLSADFTSQFQGNEDKKKHGPTLLGAGLTNRPVIKGMAPVVELTEGKGNEMNLEQALAKIAELEAKIAEMKPEAGSIPAAEADAIKKELSDLKAGAEAAKVEKALTEKKATFAKMLAEKKAIPAQEKAFLDGDMTKFVELAGTVNLSEQGHGGTGAGDTTEKSADDQILALVEKEMKADPKLSAGRATSKVLSENPALAAKR